MVGHDITKGDALFSPYRYRGQLYSIIYGQAIPSVIGQKSVALTVLCCIGYDVGIYEDSWIAGI